MSAYTKGPWFVVKASDHGCGDGLDIYAGKDWGGVYVADPLYGNAGEKFFAASKEEATANAYLLAAAPELLNGINGLLGLIQLVCSRDDMPSAIRDALESSWRVDEANLAIAKAEGK